MTTFKCVFCGKFRDEDEMSSVEWVCQKCYDAKVASATPDQVEFSEGDPHNFIQWQRDMEIDRRRAELAKKSAKISREIYELAHGEPDNNWREPVDDDFAYDEWNDNWLSAGKELF